MHLLFKADQQTPTAPVSTNPVCSGQLTLKERGPVSGNPQKEEEL